MGDQHGRDKKLIKKSSETNLKLSFLDINKNNKEKNNTVTEII